MAWPRVSCGTSERSDPREQTERSEKTVNNDVYRSAKYCLTCFPFWELGVFPGFHISGLLVVHVVLVVTSVHLELCSLSKAFVTLLGVIKRSGARVTIFSVELDDFLLIRSDTMKLYRLKIS